MLPMGDRCYMPQSLNKIRKFRENLNKDNYKKKKLTNTEKLTPLSK